MISQDYSIEFGKKVIAFCLARKFNGLRVFKTDIVRQEETVINFFKERLMNPLKITFYFFVDHKTRKQLDGIFERLFEQQIKGSTLIDFVRDKLKIRASYYDYIDIFHWIGCLRLVKEYQQADREYMLAASQLITDILSMELPFLTMYSARQIGLLLYAKSKNDELKRTIDFFDKCIFERCIRKDERVQEFISLYLYYYYDFSDGVLKEVRGILDSTEIDADERVARLRIYKPMLIAYLQRQKEVERDRDLRLQAVDDIEELLERFNKCFRKTRASGEAVGTR
jgi:hypothetical protein